MTNEKTPVYLNPKDFYAEELQSWRELWDDSLSLYENCYSICSQAVLLPYHSLQMKFAVLYCLTSSKWAKILPVLFSWGQQGSGKTTFALFASKLHGIPYLFSPSDTFASIRNALDSMRWLDPEEKTLEQDGALLCWDNLRISTLERDERIFQLLLYGYNRSTDRIQIAQADGTNKAYYVFCPKIISSIDPIHANYEFRELQRRLLIIHHKPLEKFKPHEFDSSMEGFNPSDRLDLESVAWEGIEHHYYDFWNEAENCRLYAKLRSSLTRKNHKPLNLPESITSTKWTISIDLLVTGLVFQAFSSKEQGIKELGEYWELASNFQDGERLNAQRLLAEFLDYELKHDREMNELLSKAGNTPEQITISTVKIKRFLDAKAAEGSVDISLNTKNISDVMRSLGFSLHNDKYVEQD